MWEGHKIWKNCPVIFEFFSNVKANKETFLKLLSPSQNIWTLPPSTITYLYTLSVKNLQYVCMYDWEYVRIKFLFPNNMYLNMKVEKFLKWVLKSGLLMVKWIDPTLGNLWDILLPCNLQLGSSIIGSKMQCYYNKSRTSKYRVIPIKT